MSSVHCSIDPPAAVSLLESEGCHFSEFTFLGFLPSTANASVVPRHGSVHLGLGDFFPGLLLWIRRVPFKQAHLSSDVVTHYRFCVQGSEWLVPQVTLLHTWAGEDQCRVNHLQRYYISHTHSALIIIIIIIWRTPFVFSIADFLKIRHTHHITNCNVLLLINSMIRRPFFETLKIYCSRRQLYVHRFYQ